jgi:dolichol-phosphate mannosyltransferase
LEARATAGERKTAALVTPLRHELRQVRQAHETIASLERPDLVWMPVVDADSCPGTRAWLREAVQGDPRTQIVDRGPARGLAGAYIAGYRRARRLGAAKVIEADLGCHPLKRTPELIDALDEVLVVTSTRFARGGRLQGVSARRRLITRFAALVARHGLGLPFTDCAAGFQGFRREVLELVDLDSLHSESLLIRSELKYQCRNYPFREIPIVFRGEDGTLDTEDLAEARRIFLHLLGDRTKLLPLRRRHWGKARQLESLPESEEGQTLVLPRS